MLDVTPESYVFCYDRNTTRVGSATKIAGAAGRELYQECGWTAYRFYLEFFRCPVGDPKLTRPKFEAILREKVAEAGIDAVLIHGEGELTAPHAT